MSSTVKSEPSAASAGPGSAGLLERWRPRAAAATVWYLRLIALLNVVTVLLVPFRDQVTEHNEGEYFTPYLMTAGLSSAVLSVFLAIAMRRRKRAAWIFNIALAGLFAVLYLLAMALPGEQFNHHALNYISTVLTCLFVLALLVGRRSSPPRATAPTRRRRRPPSSAVWPSAVSSARCWSGRTTPPRAPTSGTSSATRSAG